LLAKQNRTHSLLPDYVQAILDLKNLQNHNIFVLPHDY